MSNSFVLSISQGTTRLLNADKRGHWIGILAVFVPTIIVAVIGEALGTDTSFASGLVINLAYLLGVVIATFVHKAQGSGWGEIGLARPKSWPKTIVIALGALLTVVVVSIGFQLIWTNIPGLAIQPSDQSDYNPMTGNLPLFLVMVVAAWTTVVFGEEMLFRAFLIVSLAKALANVRARWALALAGSSLMFGLAHFSWGLAGMIETATFGLLVGFIYLRTGRNLWVPIIAHALANTIKFSLFFAGAV